MKINSHSGKLISYMRIAAIFIYKTNIVHAETATNLASGIRLDFYRNGWYLMIIDLLRSKYQQSKYIT